MSLDLINHKLTTSLTDENGVIFWSNPEVNVKINSEGKVFNTKTGKQQPSYISKSYGIKFTSNGSWATASFTSLYSRMVLGEVLGYSRTIKLKDSKKGYTRDNILFVHNKGNAFKKLSGVATKDLPKEVVKETPKQLVLESTQEDISMDINTSDSNTTKQFYTVYEAKNEHTTEDGAVFPTLELAQWHQEKVSKGKGNAQVVLDYNGGYVLAEQIYFQEVVYNKDKPYTNFVDVLNNNQGIVSNVQEEHCKFDKLDSKYGFHSDVCFMSLRKGIPDKVGKHQAIKIQEALEQYSNVVESLGSSVTRLESLLKQIK